MDKIKTYQPKKCKINKLIFNEIGEIKEIRIYTDKAKTRLYKKGIVGKINKMIKDNKELTLDFLPKRITNTYTNNIKVKFVTD